MLRCGYARLFHQIRVGKIPPPRKWGPSYYWTPDDIDRARVALRAVKNGRPKKEVNRATA
jgi:hypothetical protein